MKTKLKLTILITCLLVFSPRILANTTFIDSPNPPPGFELVHLSQHLRVSVFFMDQYIGYFFIDLHQNQLTFDSPKYLLSTLTGLKKNKSVLRLLNQSFPLNIECNTNGIAATPSYCEKLKEKPVYIIYEPQHEIVYLYISPAYFKKPNENGAIDFIPYPTSSWSYINKLGAAGSFSDDGTILSSQIYSSLPNYYNVYSNNILAYENNSIIGNISENNGINNGQHFQIQNLYAEHIAQDKIYTGGYMQNSTSPFFQTQTLLGAGIKTTLETIKNAEEITATPLIIFIPQASQVSIFKNDQLIFSQYLEAGYQRISTRGFPDGGYELTIKIGQNNTIYRFFTKGLSLPPEQAPQFYLMAGYLTNGMVLNDNAYNFLPDVLDIFVLQAGISKRISERIALSSDVLLGTDQGLLDFGPSFYFGNSFIKAAGLISSQQNYGLYTLFNTQKNRLNLSLILTKIFYHKTNQNYYFLNNLIDNDSASISYRLSERDFIGIQANYNKSLDQPNTYNAGVFYQRQVGNYKGAGIFFNASYNKASYIGDTYALSLSINFNHGRLAGTESLLWQNQMNGGGKDPLAVPIVEEGSTVYSHQNEQNAGYSLNEIHTISSSVSSLAGTYNYTANQAFVATYINYNQTKGEGHTTGYGGSLESELVVNQNSVRFNGLDRGNTAGAFIQVDSSSEKDKSAKFALLDANNRKIAMLPANQTVFISLPGFTDQNYMLVNFSKTDYFINEPVKHFTLYPGNIGYYSWTAEKRLIVIGRAMTKEGDAIANTWIHAGENGIFSDSEGNFQLELAQNTTTLQAGDTCKMNLPKLNIDKAYLSIGEVLCY